MPKSSNEVLLDLNNPSFQDDLLALGKEDSQRVLKTLRKLKQLTWAEVYADKGLH